MKAETVSCLSLHLQLLAQGQCLINICKYEVKPTIVLCCLMMGIRSEKLLGDFKPLQMQISVLQRVTSWISEFSPMYVS